MSAIYLHIPFCKQACHYCNFHFSTSLQQKNELIAAIVKEIHLTPKMEREEIESIYFGGGTPSILSTNDLQVIFEALQNEFLIAANAEITLEANPDDIDDAKLLQWKALGINRLSVGIQSFMDEELIWMNRAHTADESLLCIDKIKDAGFTNFSVDLIYGSPLLSEVGWRKNVETIIKKNIPHISCYALTVEPKTALEKMITLQKKEPVDADKQAKQFLLLMDWVEEAGYEHYEISNFAKPGMRSQHNSSYWQQKKYYGFGPSAHSFDGKRRWWNVANNAAYLNALQKNIIPFEEEILTDTQQLNEYIMTTLRTIEGINFDYVHFTYGENFVKKIITAAEKYIKNEKLRMKNKKLFLTKEGKLFADGIAGDLFF